MNAADVIADRAGCMWPSLDPNLRDAIATVALDALADAGFAVVELPEPDGVLGTGAMARWDSCLAGVHADPSIRDVALDYYDDLPSTPERFRQLAAALLAAANHAEATDEQ